MATRRVAAVALHCLLTVGCGGSRRRLVASLTCYAALNEVETRDNTFEKISLESFNELKIPECSISREVGVTPNTLVAESLLRVT